MMEPQTGTYGGQGGLEHLKGYYFLCITKGEGRLEASGNPQAVMLSAANAAFPNRSLRAGTSDLHWQKLLEKRWLCGLRVLLSGDCLEAEAEQASGFPRGGKTGDCSMRSAINQWELVTGPWTNSVQGPLTPLL